MPPVISCRLYLQNMYRTQSFLITCTTIAWSQPPPSSLCRITVFKCHSCLYPGSSFSALLKPKSGKCHYLLKLLQVLPISLRLKANVFRMSTGFYVTCNPTFSSLTSSLTIISLTSPYTWVFFNTLGTLLTLHWLFSLPRIYFLWTPTNNSFTFKSKFKCHHFDKFY